MEDICFNNFYASSERAGTIRSIQSLIEENFPNDWHEQSNDFSIDEAELFVINAELFGSLTFTRNLFKRFSERMEHDSTLYIHILSYKHYSESDCFIYRNGEWSIQRS